MGVSPGVPCETVKSLCRCHEPEVGTIRGGEGRIPIQRKDRGPAAPSLAFILLTATPLRGAGRRSRALRAGSD